MVRPEQGRASDFLTCAEGARKHPGSVTVPVHRRGAGRATGVRTHCSTAQVDHKGPATVPGPALLHRLLGQRQREGNDQPREDEYELLFPRICQRALS